MTPGLRKKNERRRRRMWAAPFVLTMALSPAACTKDSGDADRTTTRNPPMPVETDAATATKKPPPPPPPQPVKYAHVYKTSSGECRWGFPDDCAPGDKCNPPPPARIECPSYLPDKGARGVKKADGTCEIWIEPDCPKPVNGVAVPCNPPPPEKVECPE